MVLDFEGVELPDEVKEALNKQHEDALKGMVSADEFNKVLSNRDDLKTEKMKALQQRKEAEEAAEAARLEAAQKNGDTESLNASWQKKFDSLSSEFNGLVEKNKKAAIDMAANEFVSEHVVNDAFSREAMSDAFAKRLDIRDGAQVVLDAAGNLTALDVNDLKKEFLASTKYHAHLVGTNASGGSAPGGRVDNSSAVDLSKMTKTQISNYANENPEKYQEYISKQH